MSALEQKHWRGFREKAAQFLARLAMRDFLLEGAAEETIAAFLFRPTNAFLLSIRLRQKPRQALAWLMMIIL